MRQIALQTEDDCAAVDGYLAASLRDDPVLPRLTERQTGLIPHRAAHHGVTALLAARPATIRDLPATVATVLKDSARTEAMWDLRHRAVLAQLLDSFDAESIPAVLLKGTALAYSAYPSSALRQRGDSDILVPPEASRSVRRILMSQGFVRDLDSKAGVGPDAIRQEAWTLVAQDRSSHSVDVHWGVMNAWSLSSLFDNVEVIAQSIPIPNLARSARRIGTLHALYHACIHRGVHIRSPYYVGNEVITGGDRLIWLYDIHLVAPEMTSEDWGQFVDLAARHETGDLCLAALEGAKQKLGSNIPENVIENIGRLVIGGRPSRYLKEASFWRAFLSDLGAVPGLGGKTAFARSVLLPSVAYMRGKYPDLERYPVALLHARRLIDRLRRPR